VQHTDSEPDCKPAAAIEPRASERWNYLTIAAAEKAERLIDVALPLVGLSPNPALQSELLERAADLVDVARFAGEISLLLEGLHRPRLLGALPDPRQAQICIRLGCRNLTAEGCGLYCERHYYFGGGRAVRS
jgi:hypothetical protein